MKDRAGIEGFRRASGSAHDLDAALYALGAGDKRAPGSACNVYAGAASQVLLVLGMHDEAGIEGHLACAPSQCRRCALVFAARKWSVAWKEQVSFQAAPAAGLAAHAPDARQLRRTECY
eukprot:scaffold160089_cov23-Tisochrysis_lutea.AAC.1